MHVPSDPGSVLRAPSPVTGDPAAVEAARSFANDTVNACRDYKFSMLHEVSDHLVRSEGAAIGQVQSKVGTTLVSGAAVLERSASAAAEGFKRYAAELERIHAAARKVRKRVRESLDDIRARSAEIEEICDSINVPVPTGDWRSPPSPAMPEPVLPADAPRMDADARERHLQMLETVHAASWRSAATSWQGAYDGIVADRAEWEGLVEERRIAEGALLATLADTALGRTIVLGSVPGSRGAKYAIAHAVSGELRGRSTHAPAAPLSKLLGKRCPPAEVARLWKELEASGADTEAVIEQYCFELADLDGLPFSVMDRAGRAALAYALDPDHPEQLSEAFQRMGFEPGDRSLEDFRADLEAVRKALQRAEKSVSSDDTVLLLALGQHDGATTAGISMGDLDHASTVGVFVSGMNSDVRGIADAFEAFGSIRGNDKGTAMVTWVGYRAPGLLGETAQFRANAGAGELSRFLDGIAVQRSDTLERFVVLGHSYGTNVAAEALQLAKADVDALVTIGSAGLKYGTTAQSLGVDEIHATNAKGDNIARPIGQHLHFRFEQDGGGAYEKRVDPRELPGAREFTSEKTKNGEAVTMHNLVNPIDWPDLPAVSWAPGLLPPLGPLRVPPGSLQTLADRLDGTAAEKEIGYLNPESSTVDGLRDIMKNDWRRS